MPNGEGAIHNPNNNNNTNNTNHTNNHIATNHHDNDDNNHDSHTNNSNTDTTNTATTTTTTTTRRQPTSDHRAADGVISLYTRSPLEDSRLFGPSPWKVLATTYEQMGS